jgi:hypothetical protein
MGGTSPNYRQKLPKKRALIRRLARAYPNLPVRVGYGIDPRLNGGTQSLRRAVLGLVNKDRVDRIVVAYHGVGFSDIMQTHMIRHEIEEILGEVGAEDVGLRYSDPIGTSDPYVEAVVRKALGTDMCGDYDCGSDRYHEFAAGLFGRTKRAIEDAADRSGRTEIFHIYGDGGEGADDPNDEVDGPLEALAERKSRRHPLRVRFGLARHPDHLAAGLRPAHTGLGRTLREPFPIRRYASEDHKQLIRIGAQGRCTPRGGPRSPTDSVIRTGRRSPSQGLRLAGFAPGSGLSGSGP